MSSLVVNNCKIDNLSLKSNEADKTESIARFSGFNCKKTNQPTQISSLENLNNLSEAQEVPIITSIDVRDINTQPNTESLASNREYLLELQKDIQNNSYEIIEKWQSNDIGINHVLDCLYENDNIKKLFIKNDVNLYNSLVKVIRDKITSIKLDSDQLTKLQSVFYAITDDVIRVVSKKDVIVTTKKKIFFGTLCKQPNYHKDSITDTKIKDFFGAFCKTLTHIVTDENSANFVTILLIKFTYSEDTEHYFDIQQSTTKTKQINNNYLDLLAMLIKIQNKDSPNISFLLEGLKSHLKKAVLIKSKSGVDMFVYSSYFTNIVLHLEQEKRNNIVQDFFDDKRVTKDFKNSLFVHLQNLGFDKNIHYSISEKKLKETKNIHQRYASLLYKNV